MAKNQLFESPNAHGLALLGDINEASKWINYARAQLAGIIARQAGATSLFLKPVPDIEIKIYTRPNRIIIEAAPIGTVIHAAMNSFHATTVFYKKGSYSVDAEFDTVKRAQITYPNYPLEIASSYQLDEKNKIKCIFRAPQNIPGKMSEVLDATTILSSSEVIQIGKSSIELLTYKPYDAVVVEKLCFVVASENTIGRVFGFGFPAGRTVQHIKISRFQNISTELIGAEVFLEVKSTAVGNRGLYLKVISNGVTVESKMPEPDNPYDIFGAIDAKISADGNTCSILIRAEYAGIPEETYTRNSTNSATDSLTYPYRDVFDVVIQLGAGDGGDYYIPGLSSISVVENGAYATPISPSVTVNHFRQRGITMLNTRQANYSKYSTGVNFAKDYVVPYVKLTDPTDITSTTLTHSETMHKAESTFTNEFLIAGAEYVGYRIKTGVREFVEMSWAYIKDGGWTKLPTGTTKKAKYTGTYSNYISDGLGVVYNTSYSPFDATRKVPDSDMLSSLSDAAAGMGFSNSVISNYDAASDFILARPAFFIGSEMIGFSGGTNAGFIVAPTDAACSINKSFYTAAQLASPTLSNHVNDYTASANNGAYSYNGFDFTGSTSGGKSHASQDVAQYPQISAGISVIASERGEFKLSTPQPMDITTFLGFDSHGNMIFETGTYNVGFKTATYGNIFLTELVKDSVVAKLSSSKTTVTNVGPTSTVREFDTTVVYPLIFLPAGDNPVTDNTVIISKVLTPFDFYAHGCYGFAAPIDDSRIVLGYSISGTVMNSTTFHTQFDVAGADGRNKIAVYRPGVLSNVPALTVGGNMLEGAVHIGIGVAK